jgi:hypothetical protein
MQTISNQHYQQVRGGCQHPAACWHPAETVKQALAAIGHFLKSVPTYFDKTLHTEELSKRSS